MGIFVCSGPNSRINYSVLPCTPLFTIDLQEEIRSRSSADEIPYQAALKMLKEIHFKARIKSFLTKPVVAITASSIGLIAALCIPVTSVALSILSLLARVIMGFCFGYALENSFISHNLFVAPLLPSMSAAYKEMADEAEKKIKALLGTNETGKLILN